MIGSSILSLLYYTYFSFNLHCIFSLYVSLPVGVL